jgi:hypothetical protein
VIRPGDDAAHERRHRRHAQRVQPAKTDALHFLQIWIVPGEGDGLALEDEPAVAIEGVDGGEVLVFELG